MTLISEILSKAKNLWSTIASDVEKAASAIAQDPVFTQAAGALMSDVKQGASNALSLADTALGPFLTVASKAIEAALDTFLAGVTAGKSVAYNAVIDSVIDQAASILKSAIDAWVLKAKAKLTATSNAAQDGGPTQVTAKAA